MKTNVQNERRDAVVGGVFFQAAHERAFTAFLDQVGKLSALTPFGLNWREEQEHFFVSSSDGNFTLTDFELIRNELGTILSSEELSSLAPVTLISTEVAEPTSRLRRAEPGEGLFWSLEDRPDQEELIGAYLPIAHMDTGISLHPVLDGRFDPGNTMNLFNSANQQEGEGVLTPQEANSGKFMDHGTATAAFIIGASEDEAIDFLGMLDAGVVDLRSYRVSEGVILTVWDLKRLSDAIIHSVDNGCKVISISLGSQGGEPQNLKEALIYAHDQGVIVCCAAGQLVPFQIWPAAFSLQELCICCGASTPEQRPWGQVWWKSYQDGYVTIAAPGRTMPKAYWTSSNLQPAVKESEGSSYSTAFVASIAACWYIKNEEFLSNLASREIVPLFKRMLQGTCRPWADQRGYSLEKIGPGIIDPNALLGAIPAEYM